jgi:hypothetical protein
MAPIFQIPADEAVKTRLFGELLEINDTLYGVAFTMYKDWIYIKVIREADGMDKGEALAMLLRVGNYADQHRQELSTKYNISLT